MPMLLSNIKLKAFLYMHVKYIIKLIIKCIPVIIIYRVVRQEAVKGQKIKAAAQVVAIAIYNII